MNLNAPATAANPAANCEADERMTFCSSGASIGCSMTSVTSKDTIDYYYITLYNYNY